MADSVFAVRFWGTRGSMTPMVPSAEFGIHTTCVEVRPAVGNPILVDMGTGAFPAGLWLQGQGITDFEVFLTHLHADHITGMFRFSPLYRSDCHVRIAAARQDLGSALETFLDLPFHPVPLRELTADVELEQLPEQGEIELADRGLTVRWASVPHPQGCTAYRFDDGTSAFVFATDVELAMRDELDGLRRLVAEPYPAGLIALDGFFTPDEADRHRGWGHSSWAEARDFASELGVDSLILTHHHPGRTDGELAALEKTVPNLNWAREGQILELSGNEAGVREEED